MYFFDLKINGWFKTEDRGEISSDQLQIFGRGDALVKIGGENVDIAQLEKFLQTLRMPLAIAPHVALIAAPHPRLGCFVDLVVEGEKHLSFSSLIEQFNASVLPYERLRHIHFISKIPRSPLGKILRNELLQLLES